MKTIHGNIICTFPISLSKAGSILSKFAAANTGELQAVCAYLRRASAWFNEFNQLHRELKSNRKHRTKAPKSEAVTQDEKPMGNGLSDGDSKRKKHKEKEEQRGWFGNIDGSEGEVEVKMTVKNQENVESDLIVETEKKQRKKLGEVVNLEGVKESVKFGEYGNVMMEGERKGDKKKKGKHEDEIQKLEEDKGKSEIEEDGDAGKENKRKKHRKKRESEIGNVQKNGSGIVFEDEGKKKRKIEEVVEGREMNLDESCTTKKKKKRKSEEI